MAAPNYVGASLAVNSNIAQGAVTVSPGPPTGVQAGDLLLAFVTYYQFGGAYSLSTPAGWTLLSSTSATDAQGSFTTVTAVYAMFAPAGYAGSSWSSSSGGGSTNVGSARIVAYRGANLVLPSSGQVLLGAYSNSSSSNTLTAPAWTAPANTQRVITNFGAVWTGNNRNIASGPATLRTNDAINTASGAAAASHVSDADVGGSVPSRTVTMNLSDGFGGSYAEVALVNRPPTNPGTPTVTPNPVNTLGTITWAASTDPDGDAVQYFVELSRDNGATWTRIANNVTTNSLSYDFTNVAATTTAKVQVLAGQNPDVGAYSAWVQSAAFTVQHNQAPTAPTNLAPAGGVTVDRTQAQTLTWTFNDPDAGDAQSAYRVEYRLVGAASFTDTGFVTSSLRQHTFAAGALAAGNYEWRVTTKDSQGVTSPVSGSAFFTAASPPAGPTITAPANGATVGQVGSVAWSYPTQASFQVRRVADAAGSPDTATVYSDSGTVTSTTVRDYALTYPVNGRYEHVQVRVTDSATGLVSPYSSVRVLVSYTTPTVPVLTALPVPEGGYTAFTVYDPPPPNLMPTDASASFEDGTTGGWGANTGTPTLASATASAAHGSRVLRVTPVAASTDAAVLAPNVSGLVAGQTYTLSFSARRNTALARNLYVDATVGGTNVTRVSGPLFSGFAVALDTTLTRYSLVFTAPASGALTFYVHATSASTSTTADTWDLDAVQVESGSAASAFYLPSTPATASHNVYRRLAGQGTLSEVRVATGVGASWRDYSAASGQPYTYRVEAVAANGTSTYGADTAATLTLTGLWLHDPASAQATALVLLYDGHGRESTESVEVTTRRFAGRVLPVPEWGLGSALRVSATTRLRRDQSALREALLALMRRRAVLCWRDVRGRKVYGVLTEVPLTDDVFGQETTVALTAVDYTEAV